jgi:hypothetical protein
MMQILLWWRWRIRGKTLCRVFLQARRVSSLKSRSKQGGEDTVYEPLAARIMQRLVADVATSALPDAPVRAEPARRRRPLTPHLRRRSARLLIGLAARLDPAPRPSADY